MSSNTPDCVHGEEELGLGMVDGEEGVGVFVVVGMMQGEGVAEGTTAIPETTAGRGEEEGGDGVDEVTVPVVIQ